MDFANGGERHSGRESIWRIFTSNHEPTIVIGGPFRDRSLIDEIHTQPFPDSCIAGFRRSEFRSWNALRDSR